MTGVQTCALPIWGFKADGRRGEGECVSHLLFADDTILFCDVEME